MSNGVYYDYKTSYRTISPNITINRAAAAIEYFKITRLANVTDLDCIGMPVWIAIRPLAHSLSVSQGKGLSDELACASALMEAIELAHAEQTPSNTHVACLGIGEYDPYYLGLNEILFRNNAHDFDANQKIEWVMGYCGLNNSKKYIPRDLFNMDLTLPSSEDSPIKRSTNGLASGNSVDEAIIHSLCEIIERDQTAFWIVNTCLGSERRNTSVHLPSVASSVIQELRDKCCEAGLLLFAWYISTNVNVPCFSAKIFDPQCRTACPFPSTGFGCHPKKEVALVRAISEAMQSRITYITGSREDMPYSEYSDKSRWFNCSHSADIDELAGKTEALAFEQIDEYEGSMQPTEIRDWIISKIANDLSAPIVVDLTDEKLNIPVVFSVVPGAEAYFGHDGYMPGERMRAHYVKMTNVR